MTPPPASMYDSNSTRTLTDRLGLAPDDLPAAGNWYPEEGVLELLLDVIEGRERCEIVVCGAGLAVAVLARACTMAGSGAVTAIDPDPKAISVTREMLDATGGTARLIRAELTEYDKHNLWYARWSVSELPEAIDLLFIDGPGHFAGRTPRWPAGPELFPRVVPGGVVVLDDAKRVKEKKARQRWAEDFPNFVETKHKRPGGAVMLVRQGD